MTFIITKVKIRFYRLKLTNEISSKIKIDTHLNKRSDSKESKDKSSSKARSAAPVQRGVEVVLANLAEVKQVKKRK